jgi:hypothetical protein
MNAVAHTGKFKAQKLGDLLTAESRIGRAKRAATYAAQGLPFMAVVHIEADDGTWCELDAESEQHAKVMANTWVSHMNARGASCRMLRGALTGILRLRPFYTVYAPLTECNDEQSSDLTA